MSSRHLVPLVLSAAVVLPLAAPAAASAPPGLLITKSKLALSGIGAVKLGMSEEEVREVAGVALTRDTLNDCVFLDAGEPGTGEGPRFRFQGGKLVFIDVARPGFRTIKNIGYRSRVKAVRRAYPGAKRVRELGGGYRLVWAPKSGGDKRLVFSIAGGRVERAGSGVVPYVEQQECA